MVSENLKAVVGLLGIVFGLFLVSFAFGIPVAGLGSYVLTYGMVGIGFVAIVGGAWASWANW